MTLPTWLEIDLAALDYNIDVFHGLLEKDTGICAVVKADAYGLGAGRIVRHMYRKGLNWFALYNLEQVEAVLDEAPEANFLVLMPTEVMAISNRLRRLALKGRLHLTVHSIEQLKMIKKLALTVGSQLPVHLEIDTGMSRNGVSVDHAQEMIQDILDSRELKLSGVFTHPSSADQNDQMTWGQFNSFQRVLEAMKQQISPEVLIHFSNTHAALRNTAFSGDMARIGIGLYGYGNTCMTDLNDDADSTQIPPLKPVLRWMSRLVHVAEYPAGAKVGYGASYTTTRPSRLGIVPVGYADGYPLELSNKGVMRVGPKLKEAPVRGRVNMDQIMIDLTDIPEAGLYQSVEIYACDPEAPNAIRHLTQLATASPYELLCRLSPRLDRRYLNAPRFYEEADQVNLEPVVKANVNQLAPKSLF